MGLLEEEWHDIRSNKASTVEHQAAPDQIVRFDMITESCIHSHLHQKMVQIFASLLAYHFWTLHEEPIEKKRLTIC